jgi:hypothetical protein
LKAICARIRNEEKLATIASQVHKEQAENFADGMSFQNSGR